MLAATYAKRIGRTVAFTLAASDRPTPPAGRSEPDNIVIAGPVRDASERAAEGHCELRGTRGRAGPAATALAAARGVRSVPAVWDGERVAGA